MKIIKLKNRNIFFILTALVFTFTLGTHLVYAVCPICTIAVGAGVGLSRWLGIDDTITGLWIGGFIVSLISWTESWLEKKNIRFRGRLFIDILGYYILIVIPLYYTDILGNPINTLSFCGIDKIDKLIFGIIIGSLFFWLGAVWYFYLKKKNNGQSYFPFQKVIMPIFPLIVLSIIFYFLIP